MSEQDNIPEEEDSGTTAMQALFAMLMHPQFHRHLLQLAAATLVVVGVGLILYFEYSGQSDVADGKNENLENVKVERDTAVSMRDSDSTDSTDYDSAKGSKNENLENVKVDFDSAASALEHRSTKELYTFILENQNIDANQSFLYLHEDLQENISVCRELEKRSEELNEEQRVKVKIRLAALLLITYKIVLSKELPGENLEADTIKTAIRFSNDENPKIVKRALTILCEARILAAYNSVDDAAKLAAAQDSIKILVSRYPDEEKTIGDLLNLILNMAAETEEYEISTKFAATFKTVCDDSEVEVTREKSYALEGMLLLVQHELLSTDGTPRIFFPKDIENITDRFDSLLAKDFVMSRTVAKHLGNLAVGLEMKKHAVQAKYILPKLLDRIGDEEKYSDVRTGLQESLIRLNLQGQIVNFPDHTKTEYVVIQYIKNDDRSLVPMNRIREIQTINPNRLIECILVTDEIQTDKIEGFFASSGWKEFKFIQDPDRESVYFRTYPARTFPSFLILDMSGKVVEINPTSVELNRLLLKFKAN